MADPIPLNEHEEEWVYEGHFTDAAWHYQHRTGVTRNEAKLIVYEFYRELNGLPPGPKFIGYCDESELPIKKGDTVTIRKGTMVQNVHHGSKPAGRTYKVTVNHVLPGSDSYRSHHGEIVPFTNPRVVWAGPGGYWSEVDINDLIEEQA